MNSEKVMPGMKAISEIPMLLEDSIIQKLIPDNKRLMLFFDYDGTLSPIVNDPDDATLHPAMKHVLEICSSMFIVGIVSGRDADDVIKRVGIDGIIYAGNHGLTIRGPGNLVMDHEEAHEILPALAEIEGKLYIDFIGGPKGVQIERKKYSITVHYRNVMDETVGIIESKTSKIISGYEKVKTEKGKKNIEIKPDVDWNKGKAIKWILEKMGKWKDPDVFPVFIGDDITDEDAFKMIWGKGSGIIVGLHEKEYTYADFRLKDVNEVKTFLQILAGK